MLPSLALLQLAGTVAAVAKAHREVAQFDYSATSADGSVAAPLPVGDTCSRKYEGIGGLLNSDAPWLRGFPEPQRSDILDVLFKPQWAGSLQVLKLEVGGDGHSTINTESSHMHTEFDPPSFRRGWVTWLLQEAVKRNPAIRVGGLAWTWPAWTKNSVAKKVSYLTTWCQGIKQQFNVTVEFMGLQNEGQVTGGNEQFATALRASLDAAGFRDTIVDCCDGHDFSFLPQMADPQSDFFKAVGEF
jgi:galactosylceramidase